MNELTAEDIELLDGIDPDDDDDAIFLEQFYLKGGTGE